MENDGKTNVKKIVQDAYTLAKNNKKVQKEEKARLTKGKQIEGNDKPTVNDVIRQIRVSKNLTQQEVAERLSMSQNGYSKIERGFAMMTLEKIKEIAKALDVNYAELLSQVEGFEQEKEEFEEKKENEQITLLEQEIKSIRLRCAKKIKQVSKEITERNIEEKRLLRQNLAEKDKVIQLLEDKIRLLENR